MGLGGDNMDLKGIFENVSGGRVLDVGTGVGNFIPILQECLSSYSEIVGIDSREVALVKAREKFGRDNIKFAMMDASKMEFQNGSFDTVCISNTLHHLPDTKSILEEMKRVLIPGGFFIINEMFCDNQTEKQMSHVNVHHFQCDLDTLQGICHNRTFKKQDIIDIAKDLGLDIIGIYEHNTHEEQLKESDEGEEKRVLDDIFASMENKLEQINGLKQYDDFKSRLEKLKTTLYSKGFFTATNLIVIGKK